MIKKNVFLSLNRQIGDAGVTCICPKGFKGRKCQIPEEEENQGECGNISKVKLSWKLCCRYQFLCEILHSFNQTTEFDCLNIDDFTQFNRYIPLHYFAYKLLYILHKYAIYVDYDYVCFYRWEFLRLGFLVLLKYAFNMQTGKISFRWTLQLENYKLIDLVIAVKYDMRVNKFCVYLRYQLIYMLNSFVSVYAYANCVHCTIPTNTLHRYR